MGARCAPLPGECYAKCAPQSSSCYPYAMTSRRALERAAAWLVAIGGTAAVTAIGHVVRVSPITVGFAFLIVVLISAIRGGLLAGTVASIVATLCYNFFFFP